MGWPARNDNIEMTNLFPAHSLNFVFDSLDQISTKFCVTRKLIFRLLYPTTSNQHPSSTTIHSHMTSTSKLFKDCKKHGSQGCSRCSHLRHNSACALRSGVAIRALRDRVTHFQHLPNSSTTSGTRNHQPDLDISENWFGR